MKDLDKSVNNLDVEGSGCQGCDTVSLG